MIKMIVAIISSIAVIYIILPILSRYFDNAFLGKYNRNTENFSIYMIKRLWIYLTLPIIFTISGVSLFMFPNPNFQKKFTTTIREVQEKPIEGRDTPYDIPKDMVFPWSKNSMLAILLASTFLVSLGRILTVLHQNFLLRSLLFYTIAVIGFAWITLIINQTIPEVYAEFFILPNFINIIVSVVSIGLVVGLFTELTLSTPLIRCIGYHTDDDVSFGTYSCHHCYDMQYIYSRRKKLHICQTCKSDVFRRET